MTVQVSKAGSYFSIWGDISLFSHIPPNLYKYLLLKAVMQVDTDAWFKEATNFTYFVSISNSSTVLVNYDLLPTTV